ncbi:alpha/beta hydrolase [candidate division CSSED10-310 bacterium]|uniref:Alpha/beta hydrolase n=1 Tax=candidate division CSSED10-310 bacterium TaxID=2855610 RepID=A0ABV6YV99_UNCC1
MVEKKCPLGCLLIHGYTSSLDTIRGNREWLEKENIPYAMPILRGHGGKPEDLIGVSWEDWYDDATHACDELVQQCEKIIIIGVSMGALITLKLGLNRKDFLLAQILVAPALKFKSPLIYLLPILAKIFKFWPAPSPFNDPQCATANTNYPRFSTDSFMSLFELTKNVEKKLSAVTIPTIILHSRKDSIISPDSAEIIYKTISSRDKKIMWFEKSGHEMMQDLEADLVIAAIREYVLEKRTVLMKEETNPHP